MIKEYHFAALVYDEEEKLIHCSACGHEVDPASSMFRTGGRWVCEKCVNCFDSPSECALCSTLQAVVER